MTSRAVRRAATVLLAVVLAVLAGPAALAATPDEAVADLADQGFYVEPGARSVDDNALAGLVSIVRNGGFRFMVAILDEDPAGGATTFADAILDRVGDGTIIVLTRSDAVGVASTEGISQAEADAALDFADAEGGSDLVYVTNFASALGLLGDTPVSGEPAPEPAAQVGDSDGGGSGGLIALLVIVGVLVLVVVYVVRRSSKRSREAAAQSIANARAELEAQIDAMANDILDLSDRVGVQGSDEARQYFEGASAVYAAAADELAQAETFAQLEGLAEKVDTATWQLDAAEALLDGKELPPKPAPRETSRCFFDPAHRGPFEDATLETPAGKKQVRVCTADADKLRRGEAPQPRMVQVGRDRVPAPAAPRSHGGGGFGWMDAFSILVGGMSAGLPQRWGGRGGSRRGGLGFGRSPRRTMSAPSVRRSSRVRSPSRSTRTRTSRSRSRSSGRRMRTGRTRRRR